jgi:hypothetical protein
MNDLISQIESGAFFDAKRLRRELAIEIARLDSLLAKYHALAMNGDGLNTNAGLLYCKLSSRKAALLGLDAPAFTTSLIVHQTVAAKPTSTEQIRSVLDTLIGPAPCDGGETTSH